MSEIFFNGFGKQYIKPENKKIRKRSSVYAIVHIKDIDKYVFIVPNANIKKDFFKLAGGGIKKEENIDQALNREIIEEIGYPLNDNFKKIKDFSYVFNFKPMRDTDEYWHNFQTYCLFEVENLNQTGYPSMSWISEEENIPVELLSLDYIKNNLNNFHFTIQLAIENLILNNIEIHA
jgi:8-oxo-dGTP pyrophosphatase MutT (NUDIX family)